MFDIERWLEIGQSLWRHKLRTALTAFGVSWGVFMLVVLLGMGKGLERGIMFLFRDVAVNSVWIEGGKTSLPFQGLSPGREVKLNLDDIELLGRLPGVALIAPSKSLSKGYTVQYRGNVGSFEINTINAVQSRIEKIAISKGRGINEFDDRDARKVAVIGARVAEMLFGSRVDPIGETVSVSGIPFTIIGVYTKALGEQQPNRFYVPFQTVQRTFDPGSTLKMVALTIAPGYTWSDIKPGALALLARHHRFDPGDVAAVESYDISDEVRKVQSLLMGIRVFMILVGVGTLLAGCVGVSNTMLVTVKERTREIGIRKAIGATPGTILGMILQETLLITLASGYFGLLAGAGLIGSLRRSGIESDYFREPQVELSIALGSLAVLCVAGLVAGFLPARQAVRVLPIEALRHE
jgi:putative ABC transport system permease protein